MDDDGRDDPPTVDALADLQAGLLDDATAARLRKQVRADPDVRRSMDALTRVRREVAALGGEESAPDVDPATAGRIAGALRAQRAGAAHTVGRGRLPRSARLAV